MRSALAVLALVGSVAAQGVTQLITPASPPPQGCGQNRQGAFQITIVNITNPTQANSAAGVPSAAPQKRDVLRRQDSSFTPLEMTLSGGVLKDAKGRIGYIADNFQFQFDGPPQAGAIYTGGFSLCTNGSIALGGSAVWWQCLSGTFFNLYDRKWADHCVPCYFEAIGGAGSSVDLSAAPVIATANATASSASASATDSLSGGSSNATATSSGGSSESTGGSGSGSSSGSGSGSQTSSSASASGTAGSDATQILPSVMSVLSLAVAVVLQAL